MPTNSGIEYVNHSLGFWMGCQAIPDSPACDNCYGKAEMQRYGHDPFRVVRTSKATWRQSLAKERKTGQYKWKSGERVFICPWSDFFHKDADKWRSDAWGIIFSRPDLIWVIVTKRIERAEQCLPRMFDKQAYPNLIIMPTCENQKWADIRIPQAWQLKAKYPWLKIGVSIEPMLGEINLWECQSYRLKKCQPTKADFCNGCTHSIPIENIDWVIIGGESGPKARPMHPDWVRSVRDQCQAAGVPFFFKQWGEWLPFHPKYATAKSGYKKGHYDIAHWDAKVGRFVNGTYPNMENDLGEWDVMVRVGKKKAGCLLDGREWKEFPK